MVNGRGDLDYADIVERFDPLGDTAATDDHIDLRVARDRLDRMVVIGNLDLQRNAQIGCQALSGFCHHAERGEEQDRIHR